MEQQLNKLGNRKGMHGNQAKGAAHVRAKGWILYKHDELLGYYGSVTEAAREIRKSGAYLYQLYKGKHLGEDGQPRTKTSEGYYIKPAKTLEYKDK